MVRLPIQLLETLARLLLPQVQIKANLKSLKELVLVQLLLAKPVMATTMM
jgi:hypothetical protein